VEEDRRLEVLLVPESLSRELAKWTFELMDLLAASMVR
jgi:hypothetical protein